MAKLIPRPGIMDIAPYIGGQSKDPSFKGKLSSNESALGTSPAAVAAYKEAATHLHRYPDGGSIALRDALAAQHNLDASRIVCVSGSDDLLVMICRAYAGPGDEVLYSENGFLMYPISALSVGATPVTAPEDNYHMNVDNMLAAVTSHTKVVFVTNPSNPTGTYTPREELKRLHEGLPDTVVLVIDAAYADFVDADDFDSGLDLATTADNVMMTRTFSKMYGLASLRLGWGYSSDQIVDVLNRLRGPFNVGSPSHAAGLAALGDTEFLERARAHNNEWLAWLGDRLKELGLFAVESVANFLLVKFDSVDEAHACDLFLQEEGFFLRRMDEYGLADHLRLTVGDAEENKGVIGAIDAFVKRPNRPNRSEADV